MARSTGCHVGISGALSVAEEEEQDAGDKPFEASQKKLEDARKRGELPHSSELTSAGTFGGLLLIAAAAGGPLLLQAGETLAGFLHQAGRSGAAKIQIDPANTSAARALFMAFWPWFFAPFLGAFLMILTQRALVFAPEKLKPKLDRISPLSDLKNKFGRNGLFEFLKSTVKLCLISAILFGYLLMKLPDMLASMAADPGQLTVLMLRLSLEFVAIVFVIVLCLGALDAFWQQSEHLRKHRMSRKELQDETKNSEGDPWLKSRRRERGMEIATNRMIADVPSADVVIVNAVHYAVALKWERNGGGAPICVAKGKDDVARLIRETAMEAGVPVRSDPPTARALYRVVEVGAEIRPEHYRAVAVAIRFADAIRRRRGG